VLNSPPSAGAAQLEKQAPQKLKDAVAAILVEEYDTFVQTRATMIAKAWLRLGCIVVALMAAFSARAQVDIFMSIGGAPAAMGASPQTAPTLQGDSTDAQYPKWISLYAVSMGASRDVHMSNGTVVSNSSPNLQDISVTKALDRTSTSLSELVCGGAATVTQPIDYVTIDFRKAGTSTVFYRVQLHNVYLTSVSQGGSTGGDPSENLTLFYTRITWSYVAVDAGGKSQTFTKGWDLAKNAGF
jgi:type VI secretion system secreted protein Hcp